MSIVPVESIVESYDFFSGCSATINFPHFHWWRKNLSEIRFWSNFKLYRVHCTQMHKHRKWKLLFLFWIFFMLFIPHQKKYNPTDEKNCLNQMKLPEKWSNHGHNCRARHSGLIVSAQCACKIRFITGRHWWIRNNGNLSYWEVSIIIRLDSFCNHTHEKKSESLLTV